MNTWTDRRATYIILPRGQSRRGRGELGGMGRESGSPISTRALVASHKETRRGVGRDSIVARVLVGRVHVKAVVVVVEGRVSMAAGIVETVTSAMAGSRNVVLGTAAVRPGEVPRSRGAIGTRGIVSGSGLHRGTAVVSPGRGVKVIGRRQADLRVLSAKGCARSVVPDPSGAVETERRGRHVLDGGLSGHILLDRSAPRVDRSSGLGADAMGVVGRGRDARRGARMTGHGRRRGRGVVIGRVHVSLGDALLSKFVTQQGDLALSTSKLDLEGKNFVGGSRRVIGTGGLRVGCELSRVAVLSGSGQRLRVDVLLRLKGEMRHVRGQVQIAGRGGSARLKRQSLLLRELSEKLLHGVRLHGSLVGLTLMVRIHLSSPLVTILCESSQVNWGLQTLNALWLANLEVLRAEIDLSRVEKSVFSWGHQSQW